MPCVRHLPIDRHIIGSFLIEFISPVLIATRLNAFNVDIRGGAKVLPRHPVLVRELPLRIVRVGIDDMNFGILEISSDRQPVYHVTIVLQRRLYFVYLFINPTVAIPRLHVLAVLKLNRAMKSCLGWTLDLMVPASNVLED